MFEFHQQRRIDLTTSCRDADAIPKVAGAGEVIDRDGKTVQVMHNGILIEAGCYYGAWMTEIIRRLRGHHEPQEEAAFHVVVERIRADPPPEPVMIELGSFWAYYSLWMARSLPAARLVLVEPDHANLEAGRRNMALNRQRARHIHAAVGMPDGASAELICESDGVRRPVALVSVDGIMQREGLDHVDLLLCDAQGAELTMLDGLVELSRSAASASSSYRLTTTASPATRRSTCAAWKLSLAPGRTSSPSTASLSPSAATG